VTRWQQIKDERGAASGVIAGQAREQRMLLELAVSLAELRRRRGASQQALAEQLGVSQPNISRIEGERDLRLSTLAGFIAGLGGRLEVHAVFDDEDVSLTSS
jgi:DNA-binding XRE family transcriptional regulator